MLRGTSPPLDGGARVGLTAPPASDPTAAPLIPTASTPLTSRPPHILRSHNFPRRSPRTRPAVRYPRIQPRQPLPLPRLSLRTRPNPLPPPDLPPSVPPLAVRQRSCFRLGRTPNSDRLRTTRRNWLRFQKNWVRLTSIKSRNTAGFRRNFNNLLMLCYAHVITKIGFVWRVFTDLTLVAACGNPFVPPPNSSFRQLLLTDFAHTTRVEIRVAGPGSLRF